MGNWFHKQWILAEKGETDFIPVFVPWYWQPEYKKEAPSDFEETSYSTSISIYINPDQLGFYIKSDDKIYSYLFAEKSFQNFTLPFEYLNSESVVPILDRKWLQFETKNEGLNTLANISIAKNNASKIEQEFLINLDEYYTKNNQNETVIETENDDYGEEGRQDGAHSSSSTAPI